MYQKTVEVVPYSPSYRVYDKKNGKVCKEFDCIDSALAFINSQPVVSRHQQRLSYTLKLEPQGSVTNRIHIGYGDARPSYLNAKYRTEYEFFPPANWVILTDLGDVLSTDEVDSLRSQRRYRNNYWRDEDPRYHAMWEGLISVKGDAKKVKTNYAAHEDTYLYRRWYRDVENSRDFSFNIWGNDRYIRTTNEIRQNEAHADEYGEQMVRGRRRCLPTSWDDRNSGRWDRRKSWKDSTKRRKQWVPKP